MMKKQNAELTGLMISLLYPEDSCYVKQIVIWYASCQNRVKYPAWTVFISMECRLYREVWRNHRELVAWLS